MAMKNKKSDRLDHPPIGSWLASSVTLSGIALAFAVALSRIARSFPSWRPFEIFEAPVQQLIYLLTCVLLHLAAFSAVSLPLATAASARFWSGERMASFS